MGACHVVGLGCSYHLAGIMGAAKLGRSSLIGGAGFTCHAVEDMKHVCEICEMIDPKNPAQHLGQRTAPGTPDGTEQNEGSFYATQMNSSQGR